MYLELRHGNQYPTPRRFRGSESQTAKVWLGPDIAVTENVTLKPGEITELPLDVAGIRDAVPPNERSRLTINGRSSIAQKGGDLSLRAGRRVAEALASPAKPETVLVPFKNYSLAPLEIKQGSIGRLLSPHGAQVRGDELEQLITSKKISIQGEERQDWWLHKGADGEPLGLGMILNPEKWIPNRTEPVSLPPTSQGSYREELDRVLEPIGSNDMPHLRIGETKAVLGLSEGLIGYIDPRIDTTNTPGIRTGNRRHINARWLYPTYEWPIRTEILTSKIERERPQEALPPKAVIFTFAKVT